MLPWKADHSFVLQLRLVEEASLLRSLSWTLMVIPHLFICYHGLLWQCFPVLGLLNVLRLGPRPNIYINTYYWAHHPYNSPSKFSSLAHWEEMRISILPQLPRAYHTLPLSAQVHFLTAQRTLLTIRHPRCPFIKFMWLHVPQVL